MTATPSAPAECRDCRYTSGHTSWCRIGKAAARRPITAPRTTSPTTEVTAAALRPGDVVTNPDGSRRFAAFDVSATETGDGQPAVCVYTALSDQDAGEPAKVFFTAEETVRVRSARPIPGVSRISVNENPVLPPFYGRPIDCPSGHRWAGVSAPGTPVIAVRRHSDPDRRFRAYPEGTVSEDGGSGPWTTEAAARSVMARVLNWTDAPASLVPLHLV